jgi:hypothetical protein
MTPDCCYIQSFEKVINILPAISENAMEKLISMSASRFYPR